MILEPDVALTDYGLTVECSVFALLLYRSQARQVVLRRWFVVFYGAVGTAALMGGTVHGFLPDLHSIVRQVFWRSSLLAIGVAALAIWILSARIHFSVPVSRIIAFAAALAFAGYAIIILFVVDRFWVAIAYYLPASIFLLLVLFARYLHSFERRLLLALSGVALTFVASAVQNFGIALHPTYFNHNALYHVIQAVALLLIFLGARWLVETPDPSGD